MAKTSLCSMVTGASVYYDDETSHIATHLADTPQLLELVKDFLAQQSFREPKVFTEHDTGTTIGYADLVKTSDDDEVVYAKRLNRDTFTRFVRNRTAMPTSYFTMVLLKDAEGNYELASAWIGRTCPNFPDDVNATAESRPFWSKHALVFGGQPIQAGTLTSKTPW